MISPKNYVSLNGHEDDTTDVKEPQEWYYVSRAQVHKHGGGGLLQDNYNNSVIKALKTVYPDTEWENPSKVIQNASKLKFSKSQYVLFQTVQSVSREVKYVDCGIYFHFTK